MTAAKGKSQKLVISGEVTLVKRYNVKATGFRGAPINAYVEFENGDRGFVREVVDDTATILNCDSESTPIGSHVKLIDTEMRVGVGKELLGKVIDPFGYDYYENEKISTLEQRAMFSKAPGIAERKMLSDPLYTGVTVIDSMFPVVKGQRIAVLGDAKTGKTSILQQLAAMQAGQQTVLVFVLVGKRQSEIEALETYLKDHNLLSQSVIVAANVLDSLAKSYLAPYTGCTIAEYFWLSGVDAVVMYDDLSAHAKIYREISLVSNPNPGRDSYPGDMFYVHSSLLERAGRLRSNGATLTALPLLVTPGDDITAYLPTSIMSITDGQLIFDLNTFRKNIHPALNIGLSVSRVGGRGQTSSQKGYTRKAFQLLAEYRQAEEFSHFGSETSTEMQLTLRKGAELVELFRQQQQELFTIEQQEAMLSRVLDGDTPVDAAELKSRVQAVGAKSSKGKK